MRLREYQQAAVQSVLEAWKENNSTLIVMPTGCGKTICFAHLIKQLNLPCVLVIAHREELIMQAAKKILAITGWHCAIEMADQRAQMDDLMGAPRVIVSTIQTQCAGGDGTGRMGKFDPLKIGAVIIDESHHAPSDSYVRMLGYYRQNPNLKVLGVTATPDRADEEALGEVFQTVAFDYEILDAILDGWLIPVQQQMVTIQSLDFSAIRTTAGDLNGADLGKVMEAETNLQGVCAATKDIIGNRRTIVFSASVNHAERMAEIFNRHKPNCAEWVCGKTDKDRRRAILGRFADGTTQIVVNCGVLTEGYDNPAVEVIAMARPTKSRSLYAQMSGRALRPAENIAHLLNDLPIPAMRRYKIATSEKPGALIIDFVGNSGRHKLMTTADILGGKISDDVCEAAVREAKERGVPVDMTKLLEEQQQVKDRETAKRARLVARAKFAMQQVDPFDVFQITRQKERGWDRGKTLSEKQIAILSKQGFNSEKLGYSGGKQILTEVFSRWRDGRCSFKQAAILRKRGLDVNVSHEKAKELIDEISRREHWKPRPQSAVA